MGSLSAAQARRIALVAQGFGDPRPNAAVDRRHVRRVLAHTGLLQIDSVNVLSRAQYLPVFSRLGAYDTQVLDRAAFAHRELFEYWAHEASLVPVATHPYLRWRMVRALEKFETWGRPARLAQEHPGYIEDVLAQVRDAGPISVADLARSGDSRSSWWGWSDGKVALEWLFWIGAVTTSSRGNGFERRYDLPERVIPRAILDLPTPAEEDGQRELIRIAARAHGVATESDLRDYFRLKPAWSRPRVAELVEAGELLPVTVEGWRAPAYLWHSARIPRRAVNARALLAPFDPLIFERARTERIFGMRYRIEIYVPEPARVHGYYVLPFLLGEGLVARVDLKADRQAGVLRVPAAYLEDGRDPVLVVEALAAELAEMARWLGLNGVAVGSKGDLAPALAQAVAAERLG